MDKTIEIKLTVKEIAEQLFELDNEDVARLFSEWKNLFDENYTKLRAENKPIHIFDLNHFMMYVVPKLDDDGLDFFRSTYGTILYKLFDNNAKKHLIEIDSKTL